MLKFTLVLLLPSAILATNYGVDPRDIQSNRPMDYFEDVHNGKIKPDTNLVYNFEQFRRDQPPHVEMREERIGRYMYRKPVTTTTTTTEQPIVVPDFSHHLPDNVQNTQTSLSQLSDIIPPVKTSYRQQWNSDPSPQDWAPPPPPPTWNDFPKTFNENNKPTLSHFVQNEPNFAQESNGFDHSSQDHLSKDVPEFSIMPRGDFGDVEYNAELYSMTQANSAPKLASENLSAPAEHFGRHIIHRPINERAHPVTRKNDITHRKLGRNHEVVRNSPVNRGSHKFGWSDVTVTPEINPPSTPTPVRIVSQPPPVPTLSPWAGDNFGK